MTQFDAPNVNFLRIVDDFSVSEDNIGKTASYIAQSRAIYKIIYVHPPPVVGCDFKDLDNFDNFLPFVISPNIEIQTSRTPLQQILIWHQALHFGKEPPNQNIKWHLKELEKTLKRDK